MDVVRERKKGGRRKKKMEKRRVQIVRDIKEELSSCHSIFAALL